MSVPDGVREELRERLWHSADSLDWLRLSARAKSRHYGDWTGASDVGGILARYMDVGQVRVYIKDTLLKPYTRERMADASRPLRVLDVPASEVVASYIKPHGRLLTGGRIICWGRADDWKSVLMALHERAHAEPGSEPFAAVLTLSAARFSSNAERGVVDDAARKLVIQRLVWLDE